MPFTIETGGLSSGGTVSGNLVITGTLNVQGNVTFDVLQTTTGLFSAEGGILIDETGTEVLLVRAEADAGDVFAVNTTTPGVIITGTLSTSGILSANGGMIVDGDGAALFVVRKADDTNVFVVDTVTVGAAVTGVFSVSGAVTLTTDLTVPNGGTGASTFTDGGLLLGSGTDAFTALARGTAGQIIIGSTSGDPVMGALAGVANETAVVLGDGTVVVGLATNIVVAGTLGVTGTTTLEGIQIIDITSTEALLVRKNADAGDILTVDTSSDIVRIGQDNVVDGKLIIASSSTGLSMTIRATGSNLHMGAVSNSNLGLIQNDIVRIILDANEFLFVGNHDMGWLTEGTGKIGELETRRPQQVHVINSIHVGLDETSTHTEPTYGEMLNVVDGNIEVLNKSTLGAETLTDGDMSSTTNWAGAGEWSDTIGGTTTFTFSSTGNGTLTQTATQRVTGNEGSNARWYSFTYTVSSPTTAGGLTMTITNAFAAAAVTLATTVGTKTVTFQSHATTADTADFVLDITGASGSDAITLDDLILKEIIGGDIILGGKLTGGGSDGLQVSGGGTISTFEKDLGTVGATETIDWRDGNHQKLTLDENLTITFIDPDAPTNLVVHFVQDGSGTNTVSWPSNVDWEGGTAPIITAASSSIDIVTLYFDGSRYFGGFLQNFS